MGPVLVNRAFLKRKRRKANISQRKINASILRQVSKIGVGEDVFFSHGVLSRDFQQLRLHKFFGHKNLPSYLEKELGVVPLKKVGKYLFPIHKTRDSARSFIKSRTRDNDMSSLHWMKTPGLTAVYKFVRRNNFFGHNNWDSYLRSEINYQRTKRFRQRENIPKPKLSR